MVGKRAIPLHVNWSEELRQLLLDDRVQVDGIKIPDWPHCLLPALDVARVLNARSSRRQTGVQVHFALATTDGVASDHELARCRGFLDTTDTKLVNTHCRVPKDLIARGRLDEAGALPAALAHIEQLASQFGREAIVVEHIPESERLAALGGYPALVCRVIRETGVGLLLDISHARLSARHHGCSIEEYIDRLPMERLKLIHTTGAGQDPDGKWVDHLPMDDRDYEVLSSVLRCARMGRYPLPSAVQHEYGGISGFLKRHSSADVLEREVASLRQLLD